MDFKETIQKIKNEYNIVDYVEINGVELKNIGNGLYRGLCPFHNEKTPSFSVNEDFQNYKCFGCGESGDILSFAQHIHTISFHESLKMLAEEKGIILDEKNNGKPAHDINSIRKVISDSRDFFRANFNSLEHTHPAKMEIKKRGLNVDNEIYGYSLEKPNELYKHLKAKGHSDKNIEDSNLVLFFEDNRQPWDFFHGRLMITLSDFLGRPISFTSRKIYEDDKMKGKYVNGKESPVFHKKSNLFGANVAKTKARELNTIYVVEGQFDQISMLENGIANVVATSGTAFTDEHANLLLRIVGDEGKIVFIMDGDDAGIKAAVNIFKTSKSLHSNSFAVLLKKDKDPCDYIVDTGVESLMIEIDKALPLHDFVVDSILKSLGGSINIGNRQRFISLVAKYAKNAENSYILDSMLGKASILSAVSIDNIREIYNNLETGSSVRRTKPIVEVDDIKPIGINLNSNSEADVCMFTALSLLVRMPDELLKFTPKQIHKKFRRFISEVEARYESAINNKREWRFIIEDYTDEGFAKSLQNKEFLEDPKEDSNSTISQYKYLLKKSNKIYKEEYIRIKRAKAMSSVIDSTNPKEIAKALQMYQESHT